MGDDATDRTARTVALEEVPAFVAALFSAERPRPVVAVTTRHHAPLLDPGRLARTLAERADVVLIETGEATAALGAELGNEKLGVFGGAGRIWSPGLRRESDPYEHPLIWVHPGEPLKAEAKILDLLGCAPEPPPPLLEGSDVDALVVSVGDWGAILDVDGVPASCHVSRISREGVDDAREVLRVGQRVRGRVGPVGRDGLARLDLSAFQGDAWLTLAEQVRPGDVLRGRVVHGAPGWALVELVPGATALLPRSLMRDQDAPKALEVGAVVLVRLVALDAPARRATVSLRDAPVGEEGAASFGSSPMPRCS